jgi:hypothetical protein
MRTTRFFGRERFPSASMAHAKSLFLPADENVKLVSGEVLHPGSAAVGAGVLTSLSRYPVTPTLSVAVKLVMGTVSDLTTRGTRNLLTTGLVVSVPAPAGWLPGLPGNVLASISTRLVNPSLSESFASIAAALCPAAA